MKRILSLLVFSLLAFGQQNAGDRARAVRDLAKRGQESIDQIAAFAQDPALEVRLEVVRRLAEIGGPGTVDTLVKLAVDADPEIQVRATDALVNVYLPGYLRDSVSDSLKRDGNSLRGEFDEDVDRMVTDGYVVVPDQVISAIAALVNGSSSTVSRANAARAIGILRGRDAIPELIEALFSKEDQLMYESLIALQKIRDPSVGPQVIFLLGDLVEKVQMAALQTVGILRTTEAAPEVRDALRFARSEEVTREALYALAMIAHPADHDLFVSHLNDRDDDLRTAGAEGLARLRNPDDLALLQQAFSNERDRVPRMALAYALTGLGQLGMSEFSPLRYLVSSLNRGSDRNIAIAYLTEAARELPVRQALYPVLTSASRNEKTGLAIVLGRSGDRDSIPYLEALQNDSEFEVVQEGIRGLRTLQARLQ